MKPPYDKSYLFANIYLIGHQFLKPNTVNYKTAFPIVFYYDGYLLDLVELDIFTEQKSN